MSGRVDNRPLLVHLWQSVLTCLVESFNGTKRPPVEMLAVTRRFLRDNGQGCPDEATRAQLERLFKTYCNKVAEAMQAETPTAATLAECRKLLEMQGIRVDLPKAQALSAAKALGSLDLPFTKKGPH